MIMQTGKRKPNFIVFEVSFGKRTYKTVGIRNAGAMSVIISSVARSESSDKSNLTTLVPEISVDVGGVERTSKGVKRILRWVTKNLSVGDEVRVQIRRASRCDPPKFVKVEDPKEVVKQKRRYLEHLKKELGE